MDARTAFYAGFTHDELVRTANALEDALAKSRDHVTELERRVEYLTEEKRQLVVLCEAIGSKARSGEIPRFWETGAR